MLTDAGTLTADEKREALLDLAANFNRIDSVDCMLVRRAADFDQQHEAMIRARLTAMWRERDARTQPRSADDTDEDREKWLLTAIKPCHEPEEEWLDSSYKPSMAFPKQCRPADHPSGAAFEWLHFKGDCDSVTALWRAGRAAARVMGLEDDQRDWFSQVFRLAWSGKNPLLEAQLAFPPGPEFFHAAIHGLRPLELFRSEIPDIGNASAKACRWFANRASDSERTMATPAKRVTSEPEDDYNQITEGLSHLSLRLFESLWKRSTQRSPWVSYSTLSDDCWGADAATDAAIYRAVMRLKDSLIAIQFGQYVLKPEPSNKRVRLIRPMTK